MYAARGDDSSQTNANESQSIASQSIPNRSIASEENARECVAIDCEMVGVGARGHRSVAARVAIVDAHGTCLLDTFARPRKPVTQYRTRWSGICPGNLARAPSIDSVRQRVLRLICGKILVGHALHHDLRALNIQHEAGLQRDTACCPELRAALDAAVPGKFLARQAPSLKNLCKYVLDVEIQRGEHCTVEDAASTMRLFRYACEARGPG